MGAYGLDEDEVLCMFLEAVEEAGGVRAFARKHNVSPTFVSRVWNGKERISERLTVPMGLRPLRVFVEIKADDQRTALAKIASEGK